MRKNKITELRRKIDKYDSRILDEIGNRMTISYMLGIYKRENNIPIVDRERFEEMVNTLVKNHESPILSESFIRKLYDLIHEESCRIQKEITDNE